MVRRQKINTITNLGIKNWNNSALIPDTVFDPYLPRQGGVIKSSDFNVLFKLLQTGVNALNLHIFRSLIFNLTTTNVAVTNVADESLSGSATFQDLINKENKIRLVSNTQNIETNAQNITQNAEDILDLQNANEQNVIGSILFYNGTDTIGTEVRNQNTAANENLGFYVTFYKNRNESTAGNYLEGDTRYFIQLSSTLGALSYCQNFISGSWVAIDCPYTDSRTIVIKKTLDNALNNKLDKEFTNTSLNQKGEFNYTENASPIVKKTDLESNNYTELRILTDGAHLRKNDTTYIAETADEIVVKDLLDSSINPITQDIATIETVNNNQNTRLSLIEQTIAQAASDFGYLKQETDTQVVTTTKYITASFVDGFEFDSDYISYDNTIDPNIGIFKLTRNAKVIFEFVGNVTRDTTDTLDLIYEIWDLDNSTALASDITTFDFTTQTTIANQGGIISYSFDDIDGTNITERNFAIRFRVSTGSLTASQFKIPINVIFKTASGANEILTFEDIQNDTNAIGEDGRVVINNINNQTNQNSIALITLGNTKADSDYVDTQLDTKLTKQQSVGINESAFDYTNDANSPYIEKSDLDTSKKTRLLVFANQNPVIQTFEGESETSGTYEPTAVNELIIKNDLDKAETRINDKIEPIQMQVETNTTNIEGNTTSINTLNTLVQQSFSDSGVYTSPSGILNSESGEVRVVLTAVTPLDDGYVTVSVAPNENLFVNNFDGKVNFIVQFDGIQNDDVQKTLALKIYNNENDTIIKTITKVIPVGAYITTNFLGTLDVLTGEQVYFTYSISEGEGDLTISNDVVYNIEIQSSNNLIAVKTSELIVDKTDPELANSGANTDLNQIYTNKTAIETNANNITNVTSRVSTNETNISNLTNRVSTNETDITNLTTDQTNLANQIDNNSQRLDEIDLINETVVLYSSNGTLGPITLHESWSHFNEITVQMTLYPKGSNETANRSYILNLPTELITSNTANRSDRAFLIAQTVDGIARVVEFISQTQLSEGGLYFVKVIGKGRLSASQIATRKIKQQVSNMKSKINKLDKLYTLNNKSTITLPKGFGLIDESDEDISLYDYLYSYKLTADDDQTSINELKSYFSNLSSNICGYTGSRRHCMSFELGNVSHIAVEDGGSTRTLYPKYGRAYETFSALDTGEGSQFISDWKDHLKQINDPISCLNSTDRLCYLEKTDPSHSKTPIRIILDFNNISSISLLDNKIQLKDLGYYTIFETDVLENANEIYTNLIGRIKHASSVYTNKVVDEYSYVFDLSDISVITTDGTQVTVGTSLWTINLDWEYKDKILNEWKEFLTNKNELNYLHSFLGKNEDKTHNVNFLKVTDILSTSETEFDIFLGQISINTASLNYDTLQEWMPFSYGTSYPYSDYTRYQIINLSLLTGVRQNSDGSITSLNFRSNIINSNMPVEKRTELINSWKQFLNITDDDIININVYDKQEVTSEKLHNKLQ